MKSRKEFEDIIQTVICQLLPKMPKEDIRPAWQQEDNAGKSILNEDSTHNYSGFTPNDNFIYVKCELGPDNDNTIINDNGDTETTNTVDTTITFYGPQSYQLSLQLFSLLKLTDTLQLFESYGLFFFDMSTSIDELHELINELWYERHEFSIVFKESVSIKLPQSVKPVQAQRANVRIFGYENSDKVYDSGELE